MGSQRQAARQSWALCPIRQRQLYVVQSTSPHNYNQRHLTLPAVTQRHLQHLQQPQQQQQQHKQHEQQQQQ